MKNVLVVEVVGKLNLKRRADLVMVLVKDKKLYYTFKN